jgi:hypothetical protein
MKILSFNFICVLLVLYKKSSFINGKTTHTNKGILADIKNLKLNMTGVYEDISIIKNTTYKISHNNTANVEVKALVNNIDDSIANIRHFHNTLDKKLKAFEDELKSDMRNKNLKKRKADDNTINFYNSLSLIMLSLLAGGLVGIVFILFFSFRCDEKDS